MVKSYRIDMYEGDSGTLTITIGSGSTDITDYTFYFTVKEDIDDPDSSAIIDKVITTHSDPTIGQTVVSFVPSDTKGYYGSKVYDARFDDGTGAITTILKGTFKITQAVGDLD